MEFKPVEKIKKYDDYTINEFVKGIVEARKEFGNKPKEIDSEIEKIKGELFELEKVEIETMTEEEKSEHEEKISSRTENISKQEEEKKQIEEYIAKWEEEKQRINEKLNSKIEDFEKKISENEAKIQENENEISENEEKIKDIEEASTEYNEVAESNIKLTKQISRFRGNITRYNNKINHIKEVQGNVESETVLELKPPLKIKANVVHTLDGKRTRKISEPEKTEPIKTELVKNENDDEIVKLEDEIKKSATRMKEYKETGNYDQEALEHAHYNSLISKMNNLKNKSDAEPAKVEPVKTEPLKTEPVKTEPVKTEPVKTEPVKAEPVKTEPVKTEPAKAEPVKTEPVKTETVKAETVKAEPVKTEPVKTEPVKTEPKWHPKLTPEQIEELIANGIEPGDNEYNLYLWNYGINPFEKETNQIEKNKTIQKELKWHPKLTQEQIDYAISKDIYEPEGPEYEQFLRELGINTKTAKKDSVFKKFKNFFKNIKQRISNFGKKRLASGEAKKEKVGKKISSKSEREEFAETLYVPEDVREAMKNEAAMHEKGVSKTDKSTEQRVP